MGRARVARPGRATELHIGGGIETGLSPVPSPRRLMRPRGYIRGRGQIETYEPRGATEQRERPPNA